MENTQVEIAQLEAVISEALTRDLREIRQLQLTLLGSGTADVTLT